MSNLFITGEIGIGKTTIINKIIDKLNCSVGGYSTDREIVNGKKIFTAKSLLDDTERCIFAKIHMANGHKEIYEDSFRYCIISILEKSLSKADVIILDELGFMEDNIIQFTSYVHSLLDSDRFILGVLKKHDCQFISSIRSRKDVLVVDVNKDNRDSILDELLSMIKSYGVPFKE
ncbi:nucleoside-triphosphatase [Proteiniborus ethanoligenes]|uniref:Nucleoside-triphosphatase n=1 Tax=Proteiniborus ethanoligenes TaxID=415015 RepID=A0A1H3QDM1_9FIRM|nr:nucleoside-triphosphatase [Proteiniborus ethanoligenes]SDZ10829.1 nucleoside-triphosphatase [Proteiniborus ethanoligenes]